MLRAMTRVLRNKIYLSIFIVLAAAFFVLLFQLSVITTPGNSVQFQLGLYQFKDWFLLVGISIANALFIAMQIYIYRLQKLNGRPVKLSGGAVTSGIGASSGIAASIFGTATCSICIAALFSFLSVNSVLFLVNHKDFITVGAILLLLVSLVFTSRRFNSVCDDCKIQ